MGTIHFLEMHSLDELNSRRILDNDFRIEKVELKQFKLNKFLYNIVGEPFLWFDKNDWTDEQWKDYVFDKNLFTWVGYKNGAIAGYFELLIEDNSVEIKYFGLTEEFIGQGLGSGFLTYAIERAWEFKPSKVILNTCDKDHPRALKNYLDRGFKKIREEIS